MRLHVTSVFVNDQEKALQFYTEVLGFKKEKDIPMGKFRWLTVKSKQQASDVELLLEPATHPAVEPYRSALVKDGIPLASFAVTDIQSEYNRLQEKGVNFTQELSEMGGVKIAVLDDTCGNLIQLIELPT
ncbi:MAG: VOC family protein [Pseudobacteriovorax sp.]|nr:VOC family protein [Pseudobacteriovorax sp.]